MADSYKLFETIAAPQLWKGQGYGIHDDHVYPGKDARCENPYHWQRRQTEDGAILQYADRKVQYRSEAIPDEFDDSKMEEHLTSPRQSSTILQEHRVRTLWLACESQGGTIER